MSAMKQRNIIASICNQVAPTGHACLQPVPTTVDFQPELMEVCEFRAMTGIYFT